MSVNLYKTSPAHKKSVKRWARLVASNDKRGNVSNTEMIAMKSLVRRHLRVLMCRESNISPIPPSLSEAEQKDLLERFQEGNPLPHGASQRLITTTNFVNTGGHMRVGDFYEVESDLMRWGIRRFSFKWEAGLEDRVNTFARDIFWNSFYRAIQSRSYKYVISPHVLTLANVLPIFLDQFKQLSARYHMQCNSSEILDHHAMVEDKEKACKEYGEFLVLSGTLKGIVMIFQPRNSFIMGDERKVKVIAADISFNEVHATIPRWWSDKMVCFMELIEKRVHSHAKSRNSFPTSIRLERKFFKSSSLDYGFVPRHLPADLYSNEFKDSLLPSELWELKMKPSLLPSIENMEAIFPLAEDEMVHHPFDTPKNEYYPSDDEISSDELSDSEDELAPTTTDPIVSEIKQIETSVQIELKNLKDDLLNSKSLFINFKDNLTNTIPAHLNELESAKEDIARLIKKVDELQEKLVLKDLHSESGSKNMVTVEGVSDVPGGAMIE